MRERETEKNENGERVNGAGSRTGQHSDHCKALMSRITVAFHLHRCLKAGESVWLPTVSF